MFSCKSHQQPLSSARPKSPRRNPTVAAPTLALHLVEQSQRPQSRPPAAKTQPPDHRRLRVFFGAPRLVVLAIGVVTLMVGPPASAADDVESKLKVGLTMAATIALMNSDPDGQSCRTTLGVSTCRLLWKKFLGDRRYEVDFIWDRLVSVRVCRNADMACPSVKSQKQS